MIDETWNEELPTRDQALWPYVEKLRIWSALSAEGAPGGPDIEFRVGTSTLIVESWEQDQMRAHFDDEDDSSPRRESARLTSLALALVTKILGDVEELRIALDNHDRVFRLQAELMLDAAMSRALVEEVQSEVENSIRQGEVGTAKCLTDLRHKIQRAAGIARSRIAEAERTLAALRSAKILAEESLVIPPDETEAGVLSANGLGLQELSASESMRLAHQQERQARMFVREAQRARFKAALPSRTGTLAMGFGIAFVAWLSIAFLPTLQQQRDPIPVVSMQEFGPDVRDLFAEWVAAPPSLYLKVHDGRWAGMSVLEREVALEEVAGRASVLGYNGMVVRDSSERPLAQWLRNRGILLFPSDTEPVDAGGMGASPEPDERIGGIVPGSPAR